MLCGLGQVDVVVAGTGAHHHLELGSGVHDLLVDDIAAHDEACAILDGGYHVVFGALLHEHKLVTGVFKHFLDALDCGGGKGLAGCN